MAQEKEVVLSEIKIKIKEMKYLDSLTSPDTDRKEWFKNLLKSSIVEPIPTDEFLTNLSFQDGNKIVKEINILNGLTAIEDFQNPSNQEEMK